MLALFWSALLSVIGWPLRLVLRLIRRLVVGRRGVVRIALASKGRPMDLRRRMQLIEVMEGAARDSAVRAVVLDLGGLSGGLAALSDLRAAVERVKASGTLVVCHLDRGSLGTLYVASAADRLWLEPAADLMLTGLGSQMVFYGDALKRLGIVADIESAGAYKSFGEPWVRSHASRENREQLELLLGDVQDVIVGTIAGARGLEVSVVIDALGRSPLGAEDAVALGLADGVRYADQARDELSELLDRPARPASGGFYGWLLRKERNIARWGESGSPVVVVHLEGPVVSEPGGRGSQIAAARVVPALDRLARMDDLAAVVLYIDSPGGSALASDQIARSVRRLGERFPVVAAMGNVAASGGYYVAAPASEIVADRLTITGSIGVVGGKLAMGSLAERHGVYEDAVAVGPDVGMFGAWRPFTDDQRVRFRASLARTYARFLGVVSAGRKLPVGVVAEHAEGRVWTGLQAQERGLVDGIGGLSEAVRRARRRSGLMDAPVVHIRFEQPRFRALSAVLGRGATGVDALDLVMGALGGVATVPRLLRRYPSEPLAVLPFDIEP